MLAPRSRCGCTGTLTPTSCSLEGRFANRGEAFGNRVLPTEGSAVPATLIPVIEQNTNLQYRGKGGDGGSSALFSYSTQKINTLSGVRVTHVTGSHSLKVGCLRHLGQHRRAAREANDVRDCCTASQAASPTQITQYAPDRIGGTGTLVKGEIGAFVQDRWTIDRLTLNHGPSLRPVHRRLPRSDHRARRCILPNRNSSLRRDHHEATSRTSRRACSVGLRPVRQRQDGAEGQLRQVPCWPRPRPATLRSVTAASNQTNRSWLDADGDFVPDCDLFNSQLNGECGPWLTANFGQLGAAAVVNPDTRFGWGNRPWNSEFSASVVHELMPRVGMDVGYYRRWYGNFLAIDNLREYRGGLQPVSVHGARRLPPAGRWRLPGAGSLQPESEPGGPEQPATRRSPATSASTPKRGTAWT